ncbi:MAG: hypothetical protein ABH871_01665 [Pseudomonadota bacterium]
MYTSTLLTDGAKKARTCATQLTRQTGKEHLVEDSYIKIGDGLAHITQRVYTVVKATPAAAQVKTNKETSTISRMIKGLLVLFRQ